MSLSWQYPTDNDGADGFKAQRQSGSNWLDVINNIPKTSRQANDPVANDPGEINYCYRLFAFNSTGLSDSSNIACATTPFINLVTLKTPNVVTVSHRSTDTSSIIAIVVNKDTNIGAGGLELHYPSKYTLTVSRRGGNKSSVISLLVNKSTQVVINP
jgi:hypothetical protein